MKINAPSWRLNVAAPVILLPTGRHPRQVEEIGAGVSLRKNKKITWNAGADWNNQLSNTVKFRVTASDLAPVGNMVFILGGSFQMGDAFTEGDSDERPVHSVYLSGFFCRTRR